MLKKWNHVSFPHIIKWILSLYNLNTESEFEHFPTLTPDNL